MRAARASGPRWTFIHGAAARAMEMDMPSPVSSAAPAAVILLILMIEKRRLVHGERRCWIERRRIAGILVHGGDAGGIDVPVQQATLQRCLHRGERGVSEEV